MAIWNPWRGCHRFSEGCRFCYIHKGDAKRGQDTNEIVRLEEKFDAPVVKKKNGEYRMKGGQLVYVCFSSDFLLEEADGWRADCWRMMRERSDLQFLFLTKRIERLPQCLPVFCSTPVRHRNVICQPMLEKMDIEKYLPYMELAVVGGESDHDARPLDFQWVLDVREQCRRQGARFNFRQCGTHFIRDGQTYTIPVRQLCAQARKAEIDL